MIEEQPKPQEMQPCVVIDTNSWLSSLMLRSGTGAALLHYLNRSGGKLGLSEVVEKETRAHILQYTLEAIKDIEKGFRTIGAIVGAHSKYEVPTEQAITDGIEARFQALNTLIVPVPMTLEHARRALDRVTAKLPPNVNKEQFKDSLIWEAALDLGHTYGVHFVSKDKQFYKGQKYDDGLASQLATQCQERGIELHIYEDLMQCLAVLAEQAPGLDKNEVALVISAEIESDTRFGSVNQGLALGPLIHHEISAYYTEQYDVLGVEFELTYEGSELESYHRIQLSTRQARSRADATITIKGDCSYSMTDGRVSGTLIDRIEFRRKNESREEMLNAPAIIFLSSIIGGPREIPFSIREPLDR
ncbi:MAG TPA: PIN domain-containing protein [Chloroflexia bacterium]|jgi:hypothetical protein